MDSKNTSLKYKKFLSSTIVGVVLLGVFSGYSSYLLLINSTLLVLSAVHCLGFTIPKDISFRSTFFFTWAIVFLYLIKLVAEGQSFSVYVDSFYKYYGSLIYYLYFCIVFNAFPPAQRNKLIKNLFMLILVAAIISILGEYFFSDVAINLKQYDGADPLEGRIYGFAGRPSITAFILVVVVYLYFTIDLHEIKFARDVPLIFAFLIAFVMVGSGVGFFALVILLLIKFFRNRFLWLLVGLIFLFVLTSGIPQIEIFRRTVSLDDSGEYYINALIDLKLLQIEYLLPNGVSIIGETNSYQNGLIGGDFALPVFLGEVGFIGILLMFFSIALNISRYNIVMITLFLLTSMHYATFFWGVPSLVFGLILATTRNKSKENTWA
jgi:hypothetical protein